MRIIKTLDIKQFVIEHKDTTYVRTEVMKPVGLHDENVSWYRGKEHLNIHLYGPLLEELESNYQNIK